MRAKIPIARIEVSLKDLRVGEEAWVYPTSLIVDGNLDCWLCPDSDIFPEYDMESCVWVLRDEEGFLVSLRGVEEDVKWILTNQIPTETLIPVIRIIERGDITTSAPLEMEEHRDFSNFDWLPEEPSGVTIPPHSCEANTPDKDISKS